MSEVEANFPAWQKADVDWAARAARGSGVGGGPKGTRTSYFYNNAFAPFGRTWGAPFAPEGALPDRRAAVICDPFAPTPDPALPPAPTCVPAPTPTPTGPVFHTPEAAPDADADTDADPKH